MGSGDTKQRKRGLLLGLALVSTILFTALGVWQIERRTWKLAQIEAVTARVNAQPIAAPGPSQWSGISADKEQYRHVTLEGRLLNDRETLVQAVTEIGPGYWVVTPLETQAGYVVLVNRGYVPPEQADPRTRAAALPSGLVRVTGLLRISEPKGRFLRKNRPEQERWYSRDVEAIAKARRLNRVAPYFVDADATPNPGGWPRGGITIVSFPNNHLVYALTWFGLAMMSLYGVLLIFWRRV